MTDNPTDVEVLNHIYRTDLAGFHERAFTTLNPGVTFQPNWHIEAIAHQLNRCMSREIKRLLVCAPPRSGKSQFISSSFPAFLLGQMPSARIIVASYGEQLSKKLSSDTRLLLDESWYCKAFPKTVIGDKDQEVYFQTTKQGSRLATTVGGATTGFGADFLIVDDPMKAQDARSETERTRIIDWYDRTFRTRLDNPQTGVIVVVMQRLHEDDLASHLLAGEGWTLLRLAARAEETITYQLGHDRTYRFEAGTLLHPER